MAPRHTLNYLHQASTDKVKSCTSPGTIETVVNFEQPLHMVALASSTTVAGAGSSTTRGLVPQVAAACTNKNRPCTSAESCTCELIDGSATHAE
eukprot:COSAG01_NODE_46092_length_403_cov_0.983553_1_plen_93_part_10